MWSGAAVSAKGQAHRGADREANHRQVRLGRRVHALRTARVGARSAGFVVVVRTRGAREN